MTTMAKRKRSRKPKAEMQADDESRILREMAETKLGYEIPTSLRKFKACPECLRVPCECNQGRGPQLTFIPDGAMIEREGSTVEVIALMGACCIGMIIGAGLGWVLFS